MKNQIKNGLVTFLLVASGYSLYATSFSITNAAVYSNDKISKITVKDSNHGIIFTKIINEDAAQDPNNYLPKLNKGNYTLEIESEFYIQVKHFLVENFKITFEDANNYIIFKPKFKTNGKRVNVSRLSTTKDAIKILIYDHFGRLVFNEVIDDNLQINKSYDFSQLNKGNFNIVLETNNRTFSKKIKF